MSAPPLRQASGVSVVAVAALPDGGRLRILRVDSSRADDLRGVIRAARAERGPAGPAGAEQTAAVSATIRAGFGLLAELDGDPAGAVLVRLDGPAARLDDLAVHPRYQGRSIAATLLECTRDLLATRGARTLLLRTGAEHGWPAEWCRRHGFVPAERDAGVQTWIGDLPVVVEAATADAMRALGRRLAALLQPGDVIIATGDLGAGKTTLTQGIGAGLAVSGPVISPTFVLSRVHPGTAGGPALVHVDAYRLGSFDELEDLDLEASLPSSVTLIEWGGGIAEGMSDDRLEIDIRRGLDPDDDTRLVFLTGIGPRWAAGQLEALR